MLSPNDAELVRRDTAIPGLATLLDAEAFAACLRQHAPQAEIQGVYPFYVRYKPGMNCLVAYNLEVDGAAVAVYAKAYRAGAQEQLRKADTPGGAEGPLGEGRIVVPDLSVAVSVFPNDSRLKSLARLGNADTESALVRRVFCDQRHLWEGKTYSIRYKPERRYVARFDVEGEPEAVLKFYTPHAFTAALRHARLFRSRDLLRIPMRIGHSKRHSILALEWMGGQLLSDAFLDPDFSPASLIRVGAALAEVHVHSHAALTPTTHENEATTLLALSSWLGFLHPPIAARANRLAQQLGTLLSGAPPLYRALHGDFYAKQVLLDRDRVVVLDFDSATAGDPASDLGLFIAHLERGRLRGTVPAHLVEEGTHALLEGYAGSTGRPLPGMWPVYTAAGLLKLAPHPFRTRQDDWGGKTERIIARAETLLQHAAPSTPVYMNGSATSTVHHAGMPSKASRSDVTDGAHATVHDPFNVTADPTMPCLERALDPQVVSRLFKQRLPGLAARSGGMQLLGIRVVRHKPGRRCLIEYRLEIERGGEPPESITLLGKVRARGLDKTTFDTVASLWNGDFGPKSQDDVLVPQPAGMVPELDMWLHHKVPGYPATRLLGDAGGVELAIRIAEASYKLHRQGIPSKRRHLMSDELRILHEKLPLVAQMHPALARRVDALLKNCDRLGTSISKPVMLKGIHRDFYADQVLVDSARLYLLDFDLYCEGDPALDIGNFVGHMREYGLRKKGSPDAFKEHEHAMVERFIELSGEATRLHIAVYSALTLVRHVYLSTQFPDRRAHTETLLDLCEEELDTLLRAPARRLVVA